MMPENIYATHDSLERWSHETWSVKNERTPVKINFRRPEFFSFFISLLYPLNNSMASSSSSSSSSVSGSSFEFSSILSRGIDENNFPVEIPPWDESVPHAPKRTPHLNANETKVF